MKEERYHLALDKYDKNIVLNALNTLRTQQIQEERPTEPVDELISRVAYAPTKKVKVAPCHLLSHQDRHFIIAYTKHQNNGIAVKCLSVAVKWLQVTP